MINGLYRIAFNYDGKEPNLLLKPKVEKLFVTAYNMFCELINSRYVQWNSEYVDPNPDSDDNSDYNRYINEKSQPIFVALNELLTEGKRKSVIKRFFPGEECDFRAELNDGTIMSFPLLEEK